MAAALEAHARRGFSGLGKKTSREGWRYWGWLDATDSPSFCWPSEMRE